MKMTERLAYLLVILGLILANVYIVWWFDGHYTELMREFDVLNKQCLGNIQFHHCENGKCELVR